MCRRLTLWWTGDPDRDVILWRTSQSGGRATARQRAGKKVGSAHVGDITAIDPIAQPLTDLITFEMKRGYRDATIEQVLDMLPHVKGQKQIESFIEQTITASERAGTPHWMLIHRRDRKEAIIYFSRSLLADLRNQQCLLNFVDACPFLRMTLDLRRSGGGSDSIDLVVMHLEKFLAKVTPRVIRDIAKEYTRG